MYIVLLFHEDNDISAISNPNGTIRVFKKREQAVSTAITIGMEYLIITIPETF